MLRRRAICLALCSVLGACAQLGSFEDFRAGSSRGGTSMNEPGGNGSSAAGKAGTTDKAGATSAGSPARAGSSTNEGGGGSDGQGGAPPEGGGGSMQPVGGSGPSALLTDCVLLLHFEEASWSMLADEVVESLHSVKVQRKKYRPETPDRLSRSISPIFTGSEFH
jgi:hypothetical protein